MDAYIIVGSANTRKSSLVRSLTGCFNSNVRDILMVNGNNIKLFAKVSSLQEAEIFAKDFVSETKQSGCKHVVFCLWPTSKRGSRTKKTYPDAASYFQELENAGWNIVHIAALSGSIPANLSPWKKKVKHFPYSTTAPINQTAQEVRKYFGWI